MTPDVEVREMAITDIDQSERILKSVVDPGPTGAHNYSYRYEARTCEVSLVAEDRKTRKVVGVCWVVCWGSVATVGPVCVLAPWQGRGVGTALLHSALQHLAPLRDAKGIRRVTRVLASAPDAAACPAAQRMLERAGFAFGAAVAVFRCTLRPIEPSECATALDAIAGASERARELREAAEVAAAARAAGRPLFSVEAASKSAPWRRRRRTPSRSERSRTSSCEGALAAPGWLDRLAAIGMTSDPSLAAFPVRREGGEFEAGVEHWAVLGSSLAQPGQMRCQSAVFYRMAAAHGYRGLCTMGESYMTVEKGLGDVLIVMRISGGRVEPCGGAIVHVGPGSEAALGAAHVRFGVANSTAAFLATLRAAEQYARARGAWALTVGLSEMAFDACEAAEAQGYVKHEVLRHAYLDWQRRTDEDGGLDRRAPVQGWARPGCWVMCDSR
ncbi:unnamed protein product [Pedinophyceae sp. YPF-701]|nr:unnamed protein product [Pedinophyceae sp. YPF-701]